MEITKELKKDMLIKTGFRIPPGVKQWYCDESIKLGLTMGQYMCLVLVNYMRQMEAQNSVRVLAEMSKSDELKEQNQEIMEFMRSPELKVFAKALADETANKQIRSLKRVSKGR